MCLSQATLSWSVNVYWFDSMHSAQTLYKKTLRFKNNPCCQEPHNLVDQYKRARAVLDGEERLLFLAEDQHPCQVALNCP